MNAIRFHCFCKPYLIEENLKTEIQTRKEEQKKYGIYFDDDYNYLQHLRDSKEVSNIEWDLCERIYASDLKPQVDLPKKSEMKVRR